MALDIYTMLVMISLLTIMLAGLLAFASLHSGDVQGIRQWALAELLIGAGLGMAYYQSQLGMGVAIVSGSTLVAAGMVLQLAGLRIFVGKFFHWGWFWLVVGLMLASNLWFAILRPDVGTRVVLNSAIFALINVASARTLLVRVPQPLRAAYWFTAAAFVLLSVIFAARGVYVLTQPAGTYGLLDQVAINPITFFVGSMVQLALAFGFVLMTHYRIAIELQNIASHDSLTGALSRRNLEEEFSRLSALHARTGEPMAVMMIDIDHFKRVNDAYGHLVGDQVLRLLARLTEDTIRKQDYFARYGGEEFCILLPATTEQEGAIIAERLRQRYAAMPIGERGKEWFSSVSIGVADSVGAGLEFSGMIEAADHALYHAKQTGRDRVVMFSSLASVRCC